MTPEPILRDPFPEEEGAFVILRQDGSLASFRARLDQYDYPEHPFPSFRRARHFVRFVGTIAR